jgi:hypothetical protein
MGLEVKSEMFCTYQGNRDEALIAHLYDDDGDHKERAAFEAHVAGCSVCCAELTELATVRAQLAAWTPPEPARALTYETPPKAARRATAWATLGEIQVWAQVAAALLCVGIAAGVANLEVRYDRGGLSVRTGWIASPAADDAARAPAPVVLQTPAESGAWRADLTALEQQLRAEFRAATAASSRPAVQTSAPGTEEILRRVQALVEQSESRQQRELALRIGELLRDAQAQRTADLVRIDRTLGYIQNGTGAEVMRQRRMLNDLAVRVTQRQ